MNPKEFLLYITKNNINGMVYAGQHVGHKNDNYLGSGRGKFHMDIKRYGRESFTRRYLNIEISSKEEMDRKEIQLIRIVKALYKTKCYNVHVGGTGGYLLHYATPEFRKEVGKRISKGKFEQYKNGQTEDQLLGRKRQSQTLKNKFKYDLNHKYKFIRATIKTSEILKNRYATHGRSLKEIEASKRLRESGQYQVKFKILFVDGTQETHECNHANFRKMFGIENYLLNKLRIYKSFAITGKFKVNDNNYAIGTQFIYISDNRKIKIYKTSITAEPINMETQNIENLQKGIKAIIEEKYKGSFKYIKELLFVNTFGNDALALLKGKTSFMDNLPYAFTTRVRSFVDGVFENPKCYCGNLTKFDTHVGWREYCSLKCGMSSDKKKEKTKQTSKDRYGVENYTKSKSYKDNFSKTHW